MGMDLLAVNPSNDARRFAEDGLWWGDFACVTTNPYTLPPEGPLRASLQHRAGAVIPGRYHLFTWPRLLKALSGWGVSTDSFPLDNSGRVIPGGACRRVAEALSAHLYEYIALLDDCTPEELSKISVDALEERVHAATLDIDGWRTCGGYACW